MNDTKLCKSDVLNDSSDPYFKKTTLLQVDEMSAELIVPDLEGCELKPYVSYATKDIYQDELTSQVIHFS